jgi:hypothetical protein
MATDLREEDAAPMSDENLDARRFQQIALQLASLVFVFSRVTQTENASTNSTRTPPEKNHE